MVKLILICTPLKLMPKTYPFYSKANWPFKVVDSFVDPFCYLYFMLVSVMPYFMFPEALLLPAERGWPLCSLVCVFIVLLLSHVVSGMVLGCISS